MITLDQYAELCALMADAAGDPAKEYAIAGQRGVGAGDWSAAKQHYTQRMSDPADGGATALAFMPLYQAAQARARGGVAPCTLETYARVHAQMAFRVDAHGHPISYQRVLAEHGYTHQTWSACERYWTPRVGAGADPRFDPGTAQQFRRLVQLERERLTPPLQRC